MLMRSARPEHVSHQMRTSIHGRQLCVALLALLPVLTAPAPARAAEWSQRVNIAADPTITDNVFDSVPTLAVGESGRTVAIWYRFSRARSAVRAATRTRGGAWSAPRTISAVVYGTGGADIFGPFSVVVGADGSAVAAWERNPEQRSPPVVEVAMMTRAGHWSPAHRLRRGGTPAVAMVGGRPTVAWAVRTGNSSARLRLAWRGRGRWHVTESAPSVRPVTNVAIALTTPRSGAVFAEVARQIGDALVASTIRHDRLGIPVHIPTAADAANMHTCASPGEPATVFWRDAKGVATTDQRGAGWAPPTRLDTGGDYPACASRGGATLAGWVSQSGHAITVYRPAGSEWQAPEVVSPEGVQTGGIDVALAGDGRGIVAWSAVDGSRADIVQATDRTAEGRWSAPTTLASSLVNGPPVVGLDRFGDGVAVWPLGATIDAALYQG
jgi:hypothetical protein